MEKKEEQSKESEEDIKEQKVSEPFEFKEPETLTNDFKGKSVEEFNEEMIKESREAIRDEVNFKVIY